MNKANAILLVLALTLSAFVVLADERDEKKERGEPSDAAAKIVRADEMQWRDGPPSLPTGAQMVVLDGDPTKAGPFTIRLKMPAGYKIPAHTHPTAERVTVISGTVRLGVGEKLDENAGRELNAGDFAVLPAGLAHFAWSPREAVLQIHSEGPFQRQFVETAREEPGAKQ